MYSVGREAGLNATIDGESHRRSMGPCHTPFASLSLVCVICETPRYTVGKLPLHRRNSMTPNLRPLDALWYLLAMARAVQSTCSTPFPTPDVCISENAGNSCSSRMRRAQPRTSRYPIIRVLMNISGTVSVLVILCQCYSCLRLVLERCRCG
jgi:hypothetical protein